MSMGKISKHRASAVILTGGESSRMGFDKAAIKLNGRTLTQNAHEELYRYFDQVVISIQAERQINFFVESSTAVFVEDELPGRGPLGGIYSVMNSVKSELYFAVACDMPFVSGPLAAAMIAAAGDDYDIVIPRTGVRHLHPLHAVYRRTCLPLIHAQLLIEKNNRIIDFFDKVRVLFHDEDLLSVFDPGIRCLDNINTYSDLERIRARL